MRQALPVLFLLVLVSGCHQPGRTDGPSPNGAPVFLVDPVDPDLDPEYDFLSADLRELNGSIVLTLEFRELRRQIPQFLALLQMENATGTHTLFVRDEAAPSKPPPHLRFVVGHVVAGEYRVAAEICQILPGPPPRWTTQLDLPHNATGLEGGGWIRSLRVVTSTFENETRDEAFGPGLFAVRGGPNPHGMCPLLAEREEG